MPLQSKFLSLICFFICLNAFAGDLVTNKAQSSANSTVQKLWQFNMSGKPGKICADRNGTVYVISKSQTTARLHAISPEGKEKWHFDLTNQLYATPSVDLSGTIYVYGQDMSVTAFFQNGSVKWQVRLPQVKNELGNTEFDLKVSQLPHLIYATTTQGRIYVIFSDGRVSNFYTPDRPGHFPAPPIELFNGVNITLAFVLNYEEYPFAEIHQISSSFGEHKEREDKVTRFQGVIKYFDAGLYSRYMYIILKKDKSNFLMALYPNGAKLWSRPLTSDNSKLVQREDLLANFHKVYYSDVENSKNVIYGINIRGDVIFQQVFEAATVANIFSYQNNLVTINTSTENPAVLNMIVFDKPSGKELCASGPLTQSVNYAAYEAGKVYLSSATDIQAFQTCIVN